MVEERSLSDRFPRTGKYNPDWIIAHTSTAANTLRTTEWLAEKLDLKPGMRVLDLGCGRACSSIFLHREFGVQVWATDLWFSASENLQRIRDAGAEQGVFPIHADARSLPYADEFFDVILGIDSFMYFGTDDLFLNELARLVKPGGTIAIAGAGLIQEFNGPPADETREWWSQDCVWCLHSAAWWSNHWQKTGLVEIESADSMPDGWQLWLDWIRTNYPDNQAEIQALAADQGRHIGYIRVVSRRTKTPGPARVESIPTQYTKVPLLRD